MKAVKRDKALTSPEGAVAFRAPLKKTRAHSLDALRDEIKRMLGEEAWLPHIYHQQILTLRTRAHSLPSLAATSKKSAHVEVQHTLLGVELKVGKHRISCPDLATARYLAVFARVGCAAVAVPYDITKISPLADQLDSAWHRMALLVEHVAEEHRPAFHARLLKTLMAEVKAAIETAGAGTAVPQFNQNTRQRPSRA